MTLEQAYKKVHMMDEVLNSDILNDEEYTSIAKRCFKLMAQIGLEEQRQKQLAIKKPKYLSDWEQGFLDSYVMQGHRLHHLTCQQVEVLRRINGYEAFRYSGFIFKIVMNSLFVEKISEKSFLEEI